MIGTIGGYIGLFLGYSFLQIPTLITYLFQTVNKWYSNVKVKEKSTENNLTSNVANLSYHLHFTEDKEHLSLHTTHQKPIETSVNRIDEKILNLIENIENKLDNCITKKEMRQTIQDVLDYIDLKAKRNCTCSETNVNS